MADLAAIRTQLMNILKAQQPVLKIVHDNESKFEVSGTVPTMQGKKKVEGIYFASVIPKPKDVRLYFFPIYTHKEQMPELSPTLQKYLKGKSCFHIKDLDESLEKEISDLVAAGVAAYQKDGMLAK